MALKEDVRAAGRRRAASEARRAIRRSIDQRMDSKPGVHDLLDSFRFEPELGQSPTAPDALVVRAWYSSASFGPAPFPQHHESKICASWRLNSV